MKICPSCSARLGDDVSVCSSCEYRFDAGNGKVDSGVKKTMMGLPALTDYRSMAKGAASDDGSPAHTKSPVGSTLFGLPALNFADAFSETSESSQDATSMISAKDLKQALRKEMQTAPGDVLPETGSSADIKEDGSKMTAFGMRAPTMAELQSGRYDDAVDEPFGGKFGGTAEGDSARQRLSGASASEVSAALHGWGLDDASSEVEHHQATQVVSAEVLQRGGFGSIGRDAQAIGFDADDYSEVKHTVMGMQVDSDGGFKPVATVDRFTDATRSVNPNDLFGLDGGGLPQNILDQVRNETLARQTTSLNVPSISSTPASGLVRARTESGHTLRAMMDTPVMYTEESVAEESSVIASDSPRKAPTSGVFKKLKRRLEAEAAEHNLTAGGVDGGLSSSELYPAGAPIREDAFDDLFEESAQSTALGESTLSSMAAELASIPLMSEEFGGDLSLPDPLEMEFAQVKPEIFAEPEVAAVAPVVEVERESVLPEVAAPEVAAVVQTAVVSPEVKAAEVAAPEVAAPEVVRAEEAIAQEEPQVVVQAGVTKSVSGEQPAAKKGLSKGILIAVLVVLLILGLVAVVLLK